MLLSYNHWLRTGYCTVFERIHHSLTSSDELTSQGEHLIKIWSIKKVEFWECEPRSDAGIYDKKTSSLTYGIRLEDLVFDGNSFIGVYIEDAKKILYFNKGSITVVNHKEFVGGWGDITEGFEYYFIKNS